MKPAVVLFVITLAMLAFGAGCVTPSAPAGPTPAVAETASAAAPVKPSLSLYSLAPSDIPFTVNGDMRGTPGKDAMPASLTKYGITRLFVAEFYEGNDIMPAERNVRQVICELPQENATIAFHDIRDQLMRESETTNAKRQVEQVDGISIGDESVAFTIRYSGSTTPQFPDAVIAFRKGNMVEVVTMRSAEPDFTVLRNLAQKAASLITSA